MAWVAGPHLIVEPPVFPKPGGDYGPFEYGGNLYVVVVTTELTVYRAPSPLGPPGWTGFSSGLPFGALPVRDAVNPAVLHLIGYSGGSFVIVDFDMGSETFTAVSTSPPISISSVSAIASTDDGSVIIPYGSGLSVRSVRYKAGIWSSPVTLHTFTNSTGSVGVDRVGNDVYVAFGERVFSNGKYYLRIIGPGDTLSAEFLIFQGNTLSSYFGTGIGVALTGPVMKIYGDEIFLNFNNNGNWNTRRGGPLSAPADWFTDSFPDTSLEGPGQYYTVVNGKLFSVWNHQELDGMGGVIVDAMYGAQYSGGGIWCPLDLGIDFVEHPPAAPALAPPSQGSHHWSLHGLANGSIGQVTDFFYDFEGTIICTLYYANYTVLGCGVAGGVYPQRRRPRWIGNRR